MAEQARVEDLQRECEIAVTSEGGPSPDECPRLFAGEQVEGSRSLSPTTRVQPVSIRLPVSGVLVINPGDEVVAGDQIWPCRCGVIPKQVWQIGKVQDARQRRVLADSRQHELAQ